MGGLGDIASGMFAVIGILAALRERDRTGKGEHVDIAMYDSMVAIADVVPSLWSLGVRDRIPNAIVTTFEASDGPVVVQVSREHQFERLATAIGHSDWLDDPRFATREGWMEHLDTVIRPAVETWMGGLDKRQVCDELAAAGIPCGPCHDAEDVLTDEHLALRDMLVHFEEADGSSYVVPGNPVRISGADPRPDRRSPYLGEHTDAVLSERLGFGPDKLGALRAEGIIA